MSLIGALTSLPALGSLELYYTDSTNNLLASGSVPINSGAFIATVPPNCVFTLATIVPPSVTSLTNQSLAQGADAFFSVSATGDAPLAYQWQFAGMANGMLAPPTSIRCAPGRTNRVICARV